MTTYDETDRRISRLIELTHAMRQSQRKAPAPAIGGFAMSGHQELKLLERKVDDLLDKVRGQGRLFDDQPVPTKSE